MQRFRISEVALMREPRNHSPIGKIMTKNGRSGFHELSPRLPDNAIITADSGSVANWYARDLK